jgi:hypothetical protein
MAAVYFLPYSQNESTIIYLGVRVFQWGDGSTPIGAIQSGNSLNTGPDLPRVLSRNSFCRVRCLWAFLGRYDQRSQDRVGRCGRCEKQGGGKGRSADGSLATIATDSNASWYGVYGLELTADTTVSSFKNPAHCRRSSRAEALGRRAGPYLPTLPARASPGESGLLLVTLLRARASHLGTRWRGEVRALLAVRARYTVEAALSSA